MEKVFVYLNQKQRTSIEKYVYYPIGATIPVVVPIGIRQTPEGFAFRYTNSKGVAEHVSVNIRAFMDIDHAFQAICDIARATYESDSRLIPGHFVKDRKKGVAVALNSSGGASISVSYYDPDTKRTYPMNEYVKDVHGDVEHKDVQKIVRRFKTLRKKSLEQYRLDYLAAIPKIVDEVLYKDGTRF